MINLIKDEGYEFIIIFISIIPFYIYHVTNIFSPQISRFKHMKKL